MSNIKTYSETTIAHARTLFQIDAQVRLITHYNDRDQSDAYNFASNVQAEMAFMWVVNDCNEDSNGLRLAIESCQEELYVEPTHNHFA